MFLRLFRAGLAYRARAPVLWCPSCQTVLAREQVEADGRCERCDSQVDERLMRQWFLRIMDIDQMRFNTAIAALMTLVGRLKGRPPAPDVVRTLVSLVAPFAPRVAEELWSTLGERYSVHTSPWPISSA